MEELKKEIAEMKEMLSQLLEIQNQECKLVQAKQSDNISHTHKLPKYIPGGIGWI